MQLLVVLVTGGHISVDTAGTVHSASENNCAVFVSLADMEHVMVTFLSAVTTASASFCTRRPNLSLGPCRQTNTWTHFTCCALCTFCPVFLMHTVLLTPVWASVPPLVSWYWHPCLVHINYVIWMDISVIVLTCFKSFSAACIFCSSSIPVADVPGKFLLQDFVFLLEHYPLTPFIKIKTLTHGLLAISWSFSEVALNTACIANLWCPYCYLLKIQLAC